jgi:hypothetical protein
MESIKKIIEEAVLKETKSSVEIDESPFLSRLVDPQYKIKVHYFLTLLIAIIFSVLVLIGSFVFFISDVLLFHNNPTINEEGAIISERSCNRQSAIFLFNAADNWANTGIQLQKGDEIKISYSGGFNTDLAGLVDSAKKNNTLRRKWINLSKPDTTNYDSNLLYNYKEKSCLKRFIRQFFNSKQDAYFGSVLYSLSNEGSVQENNTNCQIEKDKAVTIEGNGNLFLSVNDIYLTSEKVDEYDSLNKKMFSDSIISVSEFEKNRSKIDLFWIIKN